MTRRLPFVAAALVASLFAAPTVRADVLLTKDGRIFEDVEIEREVAFIQVQFEHGTLEVPWEIVQEVVIVGDPGFVPETDEEKERVAEGMVRYQGEWMPVRRRDKLVTELLKERRRYVEEMKASRLWRNRLTEETKNFIFESTVPRHIFERYRDLSEGYFQEFVRLWKIKKPRDMGKLTVKFYVDQDNYRQVSGASYGVIGFFRFIEPYELNIYYDRLDPKGTEEVLFHEMGHYLQKLIDPEFKYPHWPGESLSEYYGASVWDLEKKRVSTGGILPGRVVEVQQDIENDERVTIEQLILGCQDRNYQDYTWGWTFVHYLLSSKEHAKDFRKFYAGIATDRSVDRQSMSFGRTVLRTVEGEDMMEAFRKFMRIRGDDDLREMQEAWYSHIEENLVLETSRGLEEAAMRSLRVGREQRAKRLYEEAIAAGTELSVTYHRYAELLERLDEDDEAQENWRIAISLDPLVPEYHIGLGESLLENGRDQETLTEGERLLRLALDLEPDNLYLELNLDRLLREGKRRRPSSSDG